MLRKADEEGDREFCSYIFLVDLVGEKH